MDIGADAEIAMSEPRWIELRDDRRNRLLGRLDPERLLLEVRRDRILSVVDLAATIASGFTVVTTRMVAKSELTAERIAKEGE